MILETNKSDAELRIIGSRHSSLQSAVCSADFCESFPNSATST